MSKDPLVLPETRSWRDIPQHVRPRAMSKEGRRRVAMNSARVMIGTFVVAMVCWGAWQVSAQLREDTSATAGDSRGERIRNLVLVTDGVLDRTWLANTLAIPSDATLMGLDLAQVRARLLADPQVNSAAVVRNFPATLTVRIGERSPVARIMGPPDGDQARMLMVARDGVLFNGRGFDAAMVDSLPWIEGAKVERSGSSLMPIQGMAPAADLLALAKLEDESLYRSWQSLSLARLASDGEIEVRTKQGMHAIFGTHETFIRQIARLDYLVSVSTDATRPLKEVNLALGSQVAVSYGTAAPSFSDELGLRSDTTAPRSVIAMPAFTNLTH